MKGLIYKELLEQKQVLKSMGVLSIFYVALGVMNGSSIGVTNYFPMLAMLINTMASLNCAGHDEQCSWDTFGSALPVSRTKIVMARYSMNLMVMLLTTVIVAASELVYHVVCNSEISMVEIFYPIVVSLVYMGITNPILYKFGANKGRVMIAVVTALFVGLAAVIMFFGFMADIEIDVGDYIKNHSVLLTIGLTTVSAGIYALSALLSVSIYKKKEL